MFALKIIFTYNMLFKGNLFIMLIQTVCSHLVCQKDKDAIHFDFMHLVTCPRIGKVWGPKLLVSITAWVVKLAEDVEFFIALLAVAVELEAWNVALAEELRALGDGAGKVGGKPGEPDPRRP